MPRHAALHCISDQSLARNGYGDPAEFLQLALIGALHLTAIALMDFHEGDLLENSVFALTWGFLNFFWIVVLRRPLVSAALSLAMIA